MPMISDAVALQPETGGQASTRKRGQASLSKLSDLPV